MGTKLSHPQTKARSPYRQQLIGAVLGVALLGLGTWYFLRDPNEGGSSLADLNTASLWQLSDANETSPDQTEVGTFDTVYENHAFGFRFNYPSAMEVSESEDAGGYVILAEEGAGKRNFQIFILPWDEGEGVLSPERIRADLPDIAIINPQVATLPNGQALIFESEEAGMQTREVWIVKAGYLYQITAPLAFDGTLAALMASWQFE
jgi:hypothetical protein